MPSSWSVYYVVFLSAFLALGIPAFLAGVSSLVSSAKSRTASPGNPEPPACGRGSQRTVLGRRINARVFLGINAALVLMALLLILVPCVGALRRSDGTVHLRFALLSVVTVACFALLGLLYAAKKGDLSWLRTFQDETREGTE